MIEKSSSARRYDVLVIGAGLSGLGCALSLPQDLSVAVLTKRPVPAGNTYLAQGGLAAVTDPDDSFGSHMEDTVKAGGGLVDREVARRIIEQGPELIRRLSSWGVRLEGAGGGRSGIEGGHSVRRVLHYRDKTGRHISEVMLEETRRRDNIEILENAFAINLITASHEAPSLLARGGDRCLGAYVLRDGVVEAVLARETVLASGGAGKVYRYTSNQDAATGDGIAMAARAGLPVRNMEFFQFHPTCLYHPEKRNFLVTEALRGEGAKLLNLSGKRFMGEYEPERMELAPRDVVARAIDSEMKRHGDDHVLLDATHLGEDYLRKHFPQVTEGVLSVGIRPWEEPIPVVPAAHYSVGGVDAGPDGATEMLGLRVVGESACTGFHGANRLGSNSLLEAGVMGILAADAMAGEMPEPFDRDVRDWFFGRAEPLEESVLVDHAWASMRSVMWDYVGIVRSDRRLYRAQRLLDVIWKEVEEDYWTLLPSVELLELRNLCTVCRLIVRSALSRRESRGLHYSLDCPEAVPPPRDTVVRS
jgi:L-aspartate oxidase